MCCCSLFLGVWGFGEKTKWERFLTGLGGNISESESSVSKIEERPFNLTGLQLAKMSSSSSDLGLGEFGWEELWRALTGFFVGL